MHVGRYVALQVPSAQGTGFPISNAGAVEIVVGDVAGALLAFAAIALLRNRVRFGITLAQILAAETVYDTIANIRGGVREHLMGAANGVTWMILSFSLRADGGGEFSSAHRSALLTTRRRARCRGRRHPQLPQLGPQVAKGYVIHCLEIT